MSDAPAGDEAATRGAALRSDPIAAILGVVVVPLVHLGLRANVLKARQIRDRIPIVEAATDAVTSPRLTARVLDWGPRLLRIDSRSCLARSLVLAWLLRSRGVDAHVRIGFDSAILQAGHAWVEVNGAPVNDDSSVRDRYVAFDEPYLSNEHS